VLKDQGQSWLGREGSNLRMAESKSANLFLFIKGAAELSPSVHPMMLLTNFARSELLVLSRLNRGSIPPGSASSLRSPDIQKHRANQSFVCLDSQQLMVAFDAYDAETPPLLP